MSNDLAHAPICEITDISKTRKFQLEKNLSYDLFFPREEKRVRGAYMPVVGDLIALTNVKPKCIDDLNRPYVIAYVHKMEEFEIIPSVTVLSSKLLMADGDYLMDHKKNETMFGVYLTNLTTNIRIWRSLKGQLKGRNMKIIHKVLQGHSSGNSYTCEECIVKELSSETGANTTYNDLNDSQRDAVLSCISLVKCDHMNTIKLIWGPPGTGKATTVSVMLLSLLKLNCRTLTCTPTNVAVIEIAKRVLRHVRKDRVPRFGSCYGLGDIVLFGNEKRMDMEHHQDLKDVFLDYRIETLRLCLGSWKYNLSSMISLLEDPKLFYNEYLLPLKIQNMKIEEARKNKKVDKSTIQNMKIVEARKNKKVDKSQNKKNEQAKKIQPWTFEEYISKSFHTLHEELTSSIVNMYKHLPISTISQEDMEKMFQAHDLLQSLKTFFESKNITEVFSDLKDNDSGLGCFSKWRMETKDCLHVLKQLPMKFYFFKGKLRDFCLAKACFIFCTVSSSAKLHLEEMSPIELLVIDEAAMLKECESTNPLQLRGIRHTILIGDDRQLPAMVQSKICGNAEFGRSLFERLVQLGQKKHLLNVQHRMHPTISLFPNIEFYESQIVNAESVKELSYNRSFLPGKMYGSYSFIDVPMGKEEFDDNHSRRNMVEASIVSQVFAIKKKMKLVSFSGGFEVNVRSVDGFQGGEEDVIIISTVRCNENGSIGFLSDRRRVNVALTRARHCLWILGNGTTLLNSKSVWKTLVIDAKNRGVFYKFQEDNCLLMALLYSLFEFKEMDSLQNLVSSFFTDAVWKVCFNDEFWHSMGRFGNRDTLKQVIFILEKLSSGWREINKRKQKLFNDGISSQLLQIYNVNMSLNLIWTVDIIQENLQCIQVIMVWAIVPSSSEINKIAKCVDLVYNSYITSEIDCCKYKSLQG
ncbi:hypothetical protein TanjilG_09165 [Lupinus angustifolius]|uniref:Helicase ATP-binding domain-containing protein n=1 Tax=Lupinus angustifolius TaxID=3871 RepID=A0A1J7IJM2_LUPAN|nr:hypothetical protein TanjilG_09165 [Lupinus angustifolius]